MKETKALLIQGPNIWSACREGNEKVVRRAIRKHHALIHEPDSVGGRPPLFLASRLGHGSIVKLLLDAGARDRDGTAFVVAKNEKVRNLLRVHDTGTVQYTCQDLTAEHSITGFDSQIAAIEHLKRTSVKLIVERHDAEANATPVQLQQEGLALSPKHSVNANAIKTSVNDIGNGKKNASVEKIKAAHIPRSFSRFWRKSDNVCESNVVKQHSDDKIESKSQPLLQKYGKTSDETIKSKSGPLNERTESTDDSGQILLKFYKPKRECEISSTANGMREMKVGTERTSRNARSTVVPVPSTEKNKSNQIGKNTTATTTGKRVVVIAVSANKDRVIESHRTLKVGLEKSCNSLRGSQCSKWTPPVVGVKPKIRKSVTFALDLESFHWDESTQRTDELSYLDGYQSGSLAGDESVMSESDDEDNIMEDMIIGMSLIMDDIVRDAPQAVREAMGGCFPNGASSPAIYSRRSRLYSMRSAV